MTGPASDTVAALRTEYRALAKVWDAARSDPKKANTIFKKHHALYKLLRETGDGRAAIAGLLDDPVTPVRSLAATHSLAWEPDRAQRVLEQIAQEMSTYGTTAKYTLMEYREGTLDLDW